MPSFSAKSKARLNTCHPDLQRLFGEIIKTYDCAIIEGHRDKATQDRYVKEGKSKLPWPKGKHNTVPSQAVDAAPWIGGKISWNDRDCLAFGGYVKGVAQQMGITIRWGGDWDGDNDVNDQRFNDLVHFELI